MCVCGYWSGGSRHCCSLGPLLDTTRHDCAHRTIQKVLSKESVS
jgi:hypothetical protein